MFHSWVYVHFEGDDSASFFVESTTGERRALGDERYAALNCLWNQVRLAGLLSVNSVSFSFSGSFSDAFWGPFWGPLV